VLLNLCLCLLTSTPIKKIMKVINRKIKYDLESNISAFILSWISKKFPNNSKLNPKDYVIIIAPTNVGITILDFSFLCIHKMKITIVIIKI